MDNHRLDRIDRPGNLDDTLSAIHKTGNRAETGYVSVKYRRLIVEDDRCAIGRDKRRATNGPGRADHRPLDATPTPCADGYADGWSGLRTRSKGHQDGSPNKCRFEFHRCCMIVTPMKRIYANLLFLCLLAGISGCVSVSSTSQFYFPVTTDVYPPKTKKAVIPILGKAPDRPYKVIGRLSFRSDLGWKFMRESMIYNARANGADAVILKNTDSKERVNYTQVPPRMDWVPVPGPVVAVNSGGKKCNNTSYVSYPSYIPVFQPGYVRRWVQTIIGIDAEMIVLK